LLRQIRLRNYFVNRFSNSGFFVFLTTYHSEYDLDDELRAIRQRIKHHDDSALESFRVLKLYGQIGFYGTCDSDCSSRQSPETLIAGYRIRCAINQHIVYPITVNSEMSSTELATLNRREKKKSLSYLELENLSELVIWLGGLTFYEYLRYIGYFENSESVKEKMAKNWLEGWRNNSKSTSDDLLL